MVVESPLNKATTENDMVAIPKRNNNNNNNNFPRSSSSSSSSRGAFILLEGVDRCGKTTQCSRLLQRLLTAGLAATVMRFPDRTTATGKIINEYLSSSNTSTNSTSMDTSTSTTSASSSSSSLDDHAIHLLFSANRWESVATLQQHLRQGTTVVCDRYAYSGVAFSAAKVSSDNNSNKPLLSLEWCQAPDRGLPAPDCVIFLDLTQEQAEQRGGYGGERYEQRDMQLRVRQRFADLQKLDEKAGKKWNLVNAAQSMDQVEADIWNIVQKTIENVVLSSSSVSSSPPLQKMWEEGTIDLLPYKPKEPVEKESEEGDNNKQKDDDDDDDDENQDANKENKNKTV